MNNQQRSDLIQRNITVQFEIIPEDQQQDIGDVDEMGRNIVDYMRSSGYAVTPAYTGRMGGPLFDILVQAYTVLQDNREALATAAPTLECLLLTLKLIRDHNKQHEKENKHSISTPMPIEITIPTSDGPWLIKAPDAEAAIRIMEQLPITSPEKVKKVTQHNSAKITTSLPRKRHRQR